MRDKNFRRTNTIERGRGRASAFLRDEIAEEIITARIDALEPARYTECIDSMGDAFAEEPLADWERELLGWDDEDEADEPVLSESVLVATVDYDGDLDAHEDYLSAGDLDLPEWRMAEAAYDYAYDHAADVEFTYADDLEFEDERFDNTAWLPLVTLYDPTGAREDCYDVFGGDGFIVEGPSYGGRPEGRKQDRDEWTVASLARAWDVETSVMIAMLGDYTLANETGLTASSRVPMHVIAERMEGEVFHGSSETVTVMQVFSWLLLGYTGKPGSRYGARTPDAKQRRGEEEYAYRQERLASQWREVALTSECDHGCKVEVNGLDQSRVVHYSGYGCPMASTNPWGEGRLLGGYPRPITRPGAPRPGRNPFHA